MKRNLALIFILLVCVSFTSVYSQTKKKVLVLIEGVYDAKNIPSGQGRQLVQLLGHFNTDVTIDGLSAYKQKDIEKYEYIFYIGRSDNYQISDHFVKDILATKKTLVWINNGMIDLCKHPEVESLLGFTVKQADETGTFVNVRANDVEYTKGTAHINMIQISNKNAVEVMATAFSTKPKKETPYMIKSGNFYYVADLPFLEANETDRYLYFADKLHDILNEPHAEKHEAIIRIEDVTSMHNPDILREIADIFAARGIPFLVAVVPIYVNPMENLRIPLTDRPEIVDALKYMVANGGSIVMHGVTHQNKGVSTDDFEFWDGIDSKPLKEDNPEAFAKKLELGIDEFVKNGLYPVAWETPHYGGSQKFYGVVNKFFSTCVEQRLAIDDYDYGQYFPYTIEKDLFGQKIIPENLGYVPLNADLDSSKASVDKLIEYAGMMYHVRDGIASCFFHPFLNLELLPRLIDGIKSKGFTFYDIRQTTNWVRTSDKVILTGSQTYKIKLDNSYLYEVYIDGEGNVTKKNFSEERLKGEITKSVTIPAGQMYFAEGVDYHIREITWKEKMSQQIREKYKEVFGNTNWHEARVSVCWNQFARGAAYNDQSSFVSIFKSLNINVDTIFVGQSPDLDDCNLLVVPYCCVDSLSHFDYDMVIQWVKKGGNIITDRRNKLAEKLGIKFYNTELKNMNIRDNYYPQENIQWKNLQLAYKFDYGDKDEIFCEDAATGVPVAIGTTFGQGKIIYFNNAFDPNSQFGYSRFPYAMEYIKNYFQLSPVFKRENLEFYFDPGLRPNTSIENLIKIWVKNGFRIIHVAGWHQYPKYNYDYARLIKLAHSNGMLVYAWLEPPQVSQKFYKEHPEWQERNYKGDSVRPSWRYPVALTDNNCLTAVIKYYTDFLKKYDFDGVNLAELYFEAGNGFESPTLFTPMHPSAIKEFKKKYGFDMRQIFNQASEFYYKTNKKAKEDVVNYRIDKINELKEKMVKAILEVAKEKKDLKLMITFMDTYLSPELKEQIGINSDKMIELQKKYGFLIQAEDPQNKWSTSPARYLELGKLYASKMDDPSKLLLDLNILAFRTTKEVTGFPTLTQTGIESYQLINYAAQGAPRFTVYSEASCNAQDLSYFSYASSSPVKYHYTDNGYEVTSPYSFILQLPKEIKVINVDEQPMVGYRDNAFLIPAGTHAINLKGQNMMGFSTVELQPELLSCTGNILDLKFSMSKLTLVYESFERALISMVNKPTALKIDGLSTNFEVMRGNDCFTLFLPSGKHTVEIITGDKFSNGINVTSLWSIGAIAIYGSIAVILLVLMYSGLKIMRKRLEK